MGKIDLAKAEALWQAFFDPLRCWSSLSRLLARAHALFLCFQASPDPGIGYKCDYHRGISFPTLIKYRKFRTDDL